MVGAGEVGTVVWPGIPPLLVGKPPLGVLWGELVPGTVVYPEVGMLYEDGIEDQLPLSLVPGMVVYPPDVSGGGRLVVGNGSGGNGHVGMVGGSQPKLIFLITTAQTLTLLWTARWNPTLVAPPHCSFMMV